MRPAERNLYLQMLSGLTSEDLEALRDRTLGKYPHLARLIEQAIARQSPQAHEQGMRDAEAQLSPVRQKQRANTELPETFGRLESLGI